VNYCYKLIGAQGVFEYTNEVDLQHKRTMLS